MEIILVLILAAAYFVPAIIAANRGRQAAAVFVVNLLFGWTLIGWGIALVWAVSEGPRSAPVQSNVVAQPASVSAAQPAALDVDWTPVGLVVLGMALVTILGFLVLKSGPSNSEPPISTVQVGQAITTKEPIPPTGKDREAAIEVARIHVRNGRTGEAIAHMKATFGTFWFQDVELNDAVYKTPQLSTGAPAPSPEAYPKWGGAEPTKSVSKTTIASNFGLATGPVTHAKLVKMINCMAGQDHVEANSDVSAIIEMAFPYGPMDGDDELKRAIHAVDLQEERLARICRKNRMDPACRPPPDSKSFGKACGVYPADW